MSATQLDYFSTRSRASTTMPPLPCSPLFYWGVVPSSFALFSFSGCSAAMVKKKSETKRQNILILIFGPLSSSFTSLATPSLSQSRFRSLFYLILPPFRAVCIPYNKAVVFHPNYKEAPHNTSTHHHTALSFPLVQNLVSYYAIPPTKSYTMQL